MENGPKRGRIRTCVLLAHTEYEVALEVGFDFGGRTVGTNGHTSATSDRPELAFACRHRNTVRKEINGTTHVHLHRLFYLFFNPFLATFLLWRT
jgi:hypothetical protein